VLLNALGFDASDDLKQLRSDGALVSAVNLLNEYQEEGETHRERLLLHFGLPLLSDRRGKYRGTGAQILRAVLRSRPLRAGDEAGGEGHRRYGRHDHPHGAGRGWSVLSLRQTSLPVDKNGYEKVVFLRRG
jgi:hypothetical protein